MAKMVTEGFIADTVNGIKINSSIKCNAGNLNNNASRGVAYVVMHYTGNVKDTAKANADYFSGAGRGASAHLFVDDSEIYQSVELRDTAWHCGAKQYYHAECRNANSIGIEMCCTAGNYKISEKTKKNAAYLCAHICKVIGVSAEGVDKYVVRHYDVTHKSCPAQMAGNSGEWAAFKDEVRKILGGTKNTAENGVQNPAGGKQTGGYLVRITAGTLNVRKGPGTNYPIVTEVHAGEAYTIVGEEMNGSTKWGRLKSGAGYISLGYTERA